MSGIADEKYVQLTTFTRDGRRKGTPVWIAPFGDGRVAFTTQGNTWKIKRIRNTPNVELVASSSRGKPLEGATPVTGTATVVSGEEFEPVLAAIKDKYGIQVALFGAVYAIGRLFGRGAPTDHGIIITLD